MLNSDKMTGEKSPDFACGQILFSLKLSKLNYLVKETPYSAYVTIRKKFIKESNENQSTIFDNLNLNDKEAEILALKERNKDLETNLALAKVEFEEIEIDKEALVKEISKCEEQIEHYIRKEIMLNDQIIDVTRENDDLKRTVDKISNEKGLISKQFESYKIIEKKKFTEKSVM